MAKRYSASSYEIDEEYFLWLCELVDAEDPYKGYLGIMRLMYNIEFSSRTAKLIPNDDNRIEDGKELRDRFAEESLFDDYRCLNKPCSILEMMIALAFRISENFGYKSGESWFWEMMNNLGLDRLNDSVYYRVDGEEKASEIIAILLARKYRKDGFGGLFPLDFPEGDQRKLEIWGQMNRYLVEKYMS